MPHYKNHKLRTGRYSEAGRIYLVTSCCEKHRQVFQEFTAARIVVDEIKRCATERLCDNLTYVVMPDHVHWLLQVSQGGELSNIVGLMKGRSARRVNQLGTIKAKLWQGGFHDHAVRREEDLENLSNYVVHNPLRAGLVSSVDDYPHWWSAWHKRVAVRG